MVGVDAKMRERDYHKTIKNYLKRVRLKNANARIRMPSSTIKVYVFAISFSRGRLTRPIAQFCNTNLVYRTNLAAEILQAKRWSIVSRIRRMQSCLKTLLTNHWMLGICFGMEPKVKKCCIQI